MVNIISQAIFKSKKYLQNTPHGDFMMIAFSCAIKIAHAFSCIANPNHAARIIPDGMIIY